MKDSVLTHPINSSTDLKLQIMKLNMLREDQEIALKRELKEIYYSMQLSTIIRRTVKDLTSDPEVKTTALQTAIGVGSDLLLNKILLRKGAGIKSYLINMGLKKLISYFTSGDRLANLMAKKESLT